MKKVKQQKQDKVVKLGRHFLATVMVDGSLQIDGSTTQVTLNKLEKRKLYQFIGSASGYKD